MNQTFRILYEDADIIVCYKPHGLATQSKNIRTSDLERLLLNHLAKSSKGGGKPYLAVIHRLDQPVSGILVFAKTSAAAKSLNQQLTKSGFGKHYLALVDGIPPKSADTLTEYMVKDARSNTSRICTKDTPGAKLARLHYKISNQPAEEGLSADGSPRTLLEVTLDTGRHHQIRVQLSHLGCPIVGDTKYNEHEKDTRAWKEIKLCAYKLDFLHPRTKKALHFEV